MQKALSELRVNEGYASYKAIAQYIRTRLNKGFSLEAITRDLRESHLYKKAQQAENRKRWDVVIRNAFSRLGITSRHPNYDKVRSLVNGLAETNLTAEDVAAKLDAHPVVTESRRLYIERRAEMERQIDSGIEERKKTRVDMREVLAYLAKKNGTTYVPPAEREDVQPVDVVPRHKAPRTLTGAGAITTAHKNPRTYDLPNLQMKNPQVNKSGMVRAVKLVGARLPEFRQYLYKHRDSGLAADALAVRFMGMSKPPVVKAEPEKVPVVELVPEVVQEPQPAPQPEPIAVKPEPVQRKEPAPVLTLPTRSKREGHEVTVTSRPDQADFAAAVRRNCFDRCVITGASLRQRTEAAHLVEHSAGGLDHYSNGLLLRVDLHRLFDAGIIAICPETLTVHVNPAALADDPDLQQYHSKPIAELRRAIDPANLVARWERFQRMNKEAV
ncbi:HNH endonuclease [Kluyvera sichuanensis]|uniref:HNH endonuclease n=1 Tax=Kluyvera sichuanensis TaxID=2725494 RepID=UPI003F667192